MLCTEIVKLISDGFVAIAAAVTACVAVYGVRSWARELHGRARFEVARSLAKATYRLRDSIKAARSPMIRASEFPEGHKQSVGHKKSPADEAQAYAQVFASRWEPVWVAYQEFDTQTLEAEALWGRDIRTKTDELRAQVRKLNAAMEAFVSNEASGGENFSADRDFGRQIRSEVFSPSSDEDNLLSVSIRKAIASIEGELLPHLKRT